MAASLAMISINTSEPDRVTDLGQGGQLLGGSLTSAVASPDQLARAQPLKDTIIANGTVHK